MVRPNKAPEHAALNGALQPTCGARVRCRAQIRVSAACG
jgi:hypothetical protein